MINKRCLVHRDEDFYRSNLETFKNLEYYLSDFYDKEKSGDHEDNEDHEDHQYIHFKTVEQTRTFITKYTDFFCMGHTCCSGHGVCTHKKYEEKLVYL